MTSELDEYKPFEWLKGANVSVPSQGCYPKVNLRLNADAKAPVVLAVSQSKTTSLDVLDRMLLPPEFDLCFTLNVPITQRLEEVAQLYAEMALINSLFPGTRPRDLWISHRGGWDRHVLECQTKVLYVLMVSVVHVQPH